MILFLYGTKYLEFVYTCSLFYARVVHFKMLSFNFKKQIHVGLIYFRNLNKHDIKTHRNQRVLVRFRFPICQIRHSGYSQNTRTIHTIFRLYFIFSRDRKTLNAHREAFEQLYIIILCFPILLSRIQRFRFQNPFIRLPTSAAKLTVS